MKVLLLISMTVTLAIAASGQNVSFKRGATCTNQNVEEISSRGIKVGMTLESVLSNFNLSNEKINEARNHAKNPQNFGYLRYNLGNYEGQQFGERLEGISFYNFYFLDEKLVGFTVKYKEKPKWKNADQMIEALSKFFPLSPAADWDKNQWSGSDVYTRHLTCGDYKLIVSAQEDAGTFSVSNQQTDQIVAERKKKAEDEQREKDIKAFKP